MNAHTMMVASQMIHMAENGELLKSLEDSIVDASMLGYRTTQAGNMLVVSAVENLCRDVLAGKTIFNDDHQFIYALKRVAEEVVVKNHAATIERLPEQQFTMDQYSDLVDLISSEKMAAMTGESIKMLSGFSSSTFDVDGTLHMLNGEFLRRVHFINERWVLTNTKLGELYHFQVVVPCVVGVIEAERNWLEAIMYSIASEALVLLQNTAGIPMDVWMKVPYIIPLEMSRSFAGRLQGASCEFVELVDECLEAVAMAAGEVIGERLDVDALLPESGSKSMVLLADLPSTTAMVGDKAMAFRNALKDRLFDSNGKQSEDRMTIREYFAFYAETFMKHHQ